MSQQKCVKIKTSSTIPWNKYKQQRPYNVIWCSVTILQKYRMEALWRAPLDTRMNDLLSSHSIDKNLISMNESVATPICTYFKCPLWSNFIFFFYYYQFFVMLHKIWIMDFSKSYFFVSVSKTFLSLLRVKY